MPSNISLKYSHVYGFEIPNFNRKTALCLIHLSCDGRLVISQQRNSVWNTYFNIFCCRSSHRRCKPWLAEHLHKLRDKHQQFLQDMLHLQIQILLVFLIPVLEMMTVSDYWTVLHFSWILHFVVVVSVLDFCFLQILILIHLHFLLQSFPFLYHSHLDCSCEDCCWWIPEVVSQMDQFCHCQESPVAAHQMVIWNHLFKIV